MPEIDAFGLALHQVESLKDVDDVVDAAALHIQLHGGVTEIDVVPLPTMAELDEAKTTRGRAADGQ
jgi:hypothetical protein